MNSFCIVTNALRDPELEFTGLVCDYLKTQGCCVSTELGAEADCVIVLGGDGTILETFRLLEGREVPVLGINIGHLGFLSSVERGEFYEALDALIRDEYTIETRMTIEAKVADTVYYALNDVVINRKGVSRMITTPVFVNASQVNTYFGDGVIIATPTGSTGYNLSAGGPIVTPEAELMVITPICPHSLNMRSVVVAACDEVSITVDTSRDSEPVPAILAVDGRQTAELSSGDRVFVHRSNRKVRLVRLKDKSFFKLLYMKLGEQQV